MRDTSNFIYKSQDILIAQDVFQQPRVIIMLKYSNYHNHCYKSRPFIFLFVIVFVIIERWHIDVTVHVSCFKI